MDSKDHAWISDFLASASKDFIAKIISGEGKQVPLAPWEIEAIQRGLNDDQVKFQKGAFQLPDRAPWNIFTLNREYFTHVAAYVELTKEFGVENVKIEQSYMDLVVHAPPELIAVEIKKSEGDGENLVKNLRKILPKPDLSTRDRGDDPIRKAKALLELKATRFWIITPTKRWKFQVEYPEPAALRLTSVD